jgi:hypothetical protein
MKHSGRCHCGAIRFAFETDAPLAPRACQCGFCRRHGARNVTDPAGSATLEIAADTRRYRFGAGVTDFLICGTCGVYVGAVSKVESRSYVTLNLNAFDDPCPDLAATPVSYEGEARDDRLGRRAARWTPVRVTGG